MSDIEEDKISELDLSAEINKNTHIDNNNNDKELKKYQQGKLIGKGKYSKCYEFIDKNNNHISAVKIIPKNNLGIEQKFISKIKNEIQILKSVHHENIIEFEKVYENEDNIYIFTEICKNNSLENLLKQRKTLTELEVRYYLSQILNGLKYLYLRNIMHRDLNLNNIFISDEMTIKIGDFSNAILKEKNKIVNDICGDKEYRAPEIMNNQNENGYSFEVDIWSIGIIIYTLIIGKTPYEVNYEFYEDIPYNPNKGEFIYDYKIHYPHDIIISETAKNIISKILVKNPNKRPTINDIISHPFFNEKNIPQKLPKSFIFYKPSKTFIKEYISDYKDNNEDRKTSPIDGIDELKSKIEELEIINNKLRDEIKNLNFNLEQKKKKVNYLDDELKGLYKIFNDKYELDKKKYEKQLSDESKKYQDLDNKYKELKNLYKDLKIISNKDSKKKQIIDLMEKLKSEKEKIKIFKSKLPFDLSIKENLMSVIFNSANQDIKCSIICKNTDIFSRIENCLYNKYPEYKETQNFFLCKGYMIDKQKTLDFNKIGDNDIILVNKMEPNNSIFV